MIRRFTLDAHSFMLPGFVKTLSVFSIKDGRRSLAVLPTLFFKFRVAPPFKISRATESKPHLAARWRGALPSLSMQSGSICWMMHPGYKRFKEVLACFFWFDMMEGQMLKNVLATLETCPFDAALYDEDGMWKSNTSCVIRVKRSSSKRVRQQQKMAPMKWGSLVNISQR